MLNFIYLSGGSLFLFDRKVLRYFRKDGHNWRKKKDGKTVKEAHERLKVISKDDRCWAPPFLGIYFSVVYQKKKEKKRKESNLQG